MKTLQWVPLPLWPQSASPTGAKEAEEHEQYWRSTQGDARFQRACPGLVCFALSALLPLRGLGDRWRARLRLLASCDGAGETPAPRPGDGVRATAGRGAGEVIRERLRNAIWRSCEVLNPCVGAGETPAPRPGNGARDGTEDGGARVFHTGNYWLF